MYKKIDRIPSLLLLIFLPAILVGCNSQQTDEFVYTTLTKAALTAGDAIPLPSEEAIITVTGKIGTSNQDGNIVMDIPTIESLGLVEYTVSVDPFADREIVYEGVLMNDLLDLWQIDADATILKMTALNDYQVDVPLELIREYPVVFALKTDGEYMSIAEKGPAMLVFPYDHFEFEQPGTNQYWIWQIKSIDVE